MINKIKNMINKSFVNQNETLHRLSILEKEIQELNWANVYHDSIRGCTSVENLSLNIGRWAGNYSFFYVLHRVLKDFKPSNILELGLGESTKFISSYIDTELPNTQHIIVEHDPKWVNTFNISNKLSNQTKVILKGLEEVTINNEKVIGYKDFSTNLANSYDLIVIDGPFGSDRFSRYDIVNYLQHNELPQDFVILFDDTHRQGENDTVNVLIDMLKKQNKTFYTSNYEGSKTCTIITSQKFLTSL